MSPRCLVSPPARVEPLNLGLLAQKGSLFVTRPTLFTYAAKRENLVAMANELFDVVKSGAVKIEVHQTYPLKDAAQGACRSRRAQDHGLDRSARCDRSRLSVRRRRA